jgi:hypothetical protein
MENMECPHCYASVMIGKNGRCPACQSDVHNATEEAKSKTLVTITRDHALPAVCMMCGVDTDRKKRSTFTYWHSNAEEIPKELYIAAAVSLGLLLLVWPLVKRQLRNSRAIKTTLDLPICLPCEQEDKPVKLKTIEGNELFFVAHKNFKKQMATF